MPGEYGVNNSYGIGMVSGIESYSGQQANRAISSDKWQDGVRNDRNIAKTRNALLKYARRLLKEDKLRILSAQGVNLGGVNEDELDDKFVEMLIVNLPQKEVDILIQQASDFEKKLQNDMSRAKANLQRTIDMSKRAARAATAQQKQNLQITVSGSKTKSAYVKEVEKGRTKNIQKQVKVTRLRIKGLKGLKKELEYILTKLYFKGDVFRLAVEMEIELQGGENIKSVTESVIERVMAYASMMLGKTPNYIGGMVHNLKPYHELLRMTSYSYLTGLPGQSIAEIQEQQKAALAAKQQAKVMARSKAGNIFQRRAARKAMGKKFSPFAKKLSGILENMSNLELMDMASKLGIPTLGKNMDRYKLGKQIQDVMAERYLREEKLKEKQKKLKRVGKVNASLEAELQALRDTNPFLKKGDGGDTSTEIKPVLFNKAGQIISDSILKAMPVYVVGYGRAGQFKEEKKEEESDGDEDRVSLGGKIKGFFKNIGATITDPFTRGRRIRKSVKDDTTDDSKYTDEDATPSLPSIPGGPPTPKPLAPVLNFPDWLHKYFPDVEAAFTTNEDGTPNGLTGADMMSNPKANKEVMEEYERYLEFKKRQSAEYEKNAATLVDGTMSGFEFANGVITRLDTIIGIMQKSAGSGSLTPALTPERYTNINRMGENMVNIAESKRKRQRLKDVYVIPSAAAKDVNALMQADIVSRGTPGAVKRKLNEDEILILKNKNITVNGVTSSAATAAKRQDENLANIAATLTDIYDEAKTISDFLTMSLPTMYASFTLAAPMGVGIMTNPAALAMLGVNTAAGTLKMATKQMLQSIGAHATGGSGRYVGAVPSGMTQFISGDSLDGNENRELVNIDWAKKTYHVKPIPKFATGGTGNQTTKISGMTSSERSAPMSVGITGPVAEYSFVPEGVTDIGEKQAVKVINVTPGFYDIHPTYGMSAMDVLVTMSTTLGTIGTLMNAEVELEKLQTASLEAMSKSAARGGGSSSVLGAGFTTALDSILEGN